MYTGKAIGEENWSFRGQATGEDIWMCSITYYGEVHLEILENRLMGKTFGGFREQATGKYIWSFSCRS